MKVCVIQPYYSQNSADTEKCFRDMLALMDQCDDSMDLIVLPESCTTPAAVNADEYYECLERYTPVMAEKTAALAKRCHAMVCANYDWKSKTGWRNTTHVFNREGEEIGLYFKAHPAPSEADSREEGGLGLDCSYSYEYAQPYVIEAEGLRIGFMTCYDFYMYEAFPALARQNVDLIIGCSHQRTDTHSVLETIGRFLCYNTNAYLVRSSVSLGEESKVCGCSMVVAPDGEMLLNMQSRIGLGVIEIDPQKKHAKPAGFRRPPKPHWQYIEDGRRPWLYQPAGSMMIADDDHLSYPRICAHRGFNTIAPENSMPAFGAAVALGAEEIEFDLWSTRDGVLVSSHDRTLDRVSDGSGDICEHTYEELLKLDFGAKKDEHYRGLHVIRFDEILRKFACTTIMNIHVKIWDHEELDPRMEQIASLIRQYGAEKHCYIMNSNDKRMKEFHEIAPEINLCVGWDHNKEDMLSMPKRALAVGAKKVQLFKPYFDQSSVDFAHEHGILCNVFYADDPEEAIRYIDMGIDCILTNDYLRISNAVRAHLSK